MTVLRFPDGTTRSRETEACHRLSILCILIAKQTQPNKGSLMLADERFEKILALLKSNGFCTSQSLASELEVSDMTIRRDLAVLDKQGKIKRVHGGARILHRQENGPQKRAELNATEKKAIAEAAVDFIKEGETVFIDAGSTMLELAYALRERNLKHLRVVTHAVSVAAALSSDEITVVQLGGEVYRSSGAVVGQQALRFLESSRFDRCFLAATAVNVDFGVSDLHLPEIEIKRAALQHSAWTAVLFDATKWGAQSMLRVASLREIQCAISDVGLSMDARQALISRGLDLVIAEGERVVMT
jgi:DeoR/GlpR family transcriptional regulator of sugar metabolism